MLWCHGAQNTDYPIIDLNPHWPKVHRIITMQARPRQADGRTDRQTDRHRGNSTTICSMYASHAKNLQLTKPTDRHTIRSNETKVWFRCISCYPDQSKRLF